MNTITRRGGIGSSVPVFGLRPIKAAAAPFTVEAITAPVHDTAALKSVVTAQARELNGDLILMPDGFLPFPPELGRLLSHRSVEKPPP